MGAAPSCSVLATIGTSLALVACAPANDGAVAPPPVTSVATAVTSASASAVAAPSAPPVGPLTYTLVPPATEFDFADPRPAEAAGLRASLRDPVRSPDGSGFSVSFVLTNTTDAPIPVFQRWNSWGAYQWKIAIEDAKGQRVVAVNPQQAWTRNAPTAVFVEPHAELVLTSLVQAEPPNDMRPGVDRFTTGTRVGFPLRVRGLFACERNDEPGLRVGAGQRTIATSDLWVGAIASPWIDVR